MLRKLFTFIYEFLFIDSRTDKMSHTKFLSVAAGIMMLVMFPYAVIHGDNAGAELWLIFGGLVFGSRHLGTYLKERGKKES